jgi:hypothetical protein
MIRVLSKRNSPEHRYVGGCVDVLYTNQDLYANYKNKQVMILVVSETEPGGSKYSNDHADAASLMAIMASEIYTLQVWHKLLFFYKIRRYEHH